VSNPGRRARATVLIGAVIVAGAFVYLLSGGISNNLVYFYTPGELLASGTDDPVRLGGQVKPGSVTWDAQALDLRFVLQDTDGEVPVHATSAPPQMFREGQGVVVEGRFTEAGVFEADNVMVRHSNEYRAPAEGEHPRDAYKSLIDDGATP
jgi:cytochrome c-type biogenesis protein CcmE